MGDFGVAGVARANLFVGRVWCLATREAAGDGNDSGQSFIDGFRAGLCGDGWETCPYDKMTRERYEWERGQALGCAAFGAMRICE